MTNSEDIARIAELAIPPAWDNVWICSDPKGHLQATGIDAAGRKQYRYHDDWRTRRDQEKFDSMIEFAAALPTIRKRVKRDLKGTEMTRERVLACAVRLLDLGFFRVGGESYAEQNESYGLATIRKEHVTLTDGKLSFAYPAKSGQTQEHEIPADDIADIIETLKRRRGGKNELLAFRRDGAWVDVRSEDINEHIKAMSGGDFTAKDFRTWNATVVAAIALAADAEEAVTKGKRKTAINNAVKGVAFFLGNTPAVARSSYIDPRVIDRFQSGWTIGGMLKRIPGAPELADPRKRPRIEEAVLDLLTEKETPALEKVA